MANPAGNTPTDVQYAVISDVSRIFPIYVPNKDLKKKNV
jgi:phosphosulfolactate phosphohydrolase-like enzyme